MFKKFKMEKDITFYLYATCNASIFNTLCGIQQAGNTQLWNVRWSRAPLENYLYYFLFFLNVYYAHIWNLNNKNILMLKGHEAY